jgi:hypothetical protein
MDSAPPARNSRFGVIFTSIVVGGSAIGVLGWHVFANRSDPALNTTGFDLNTAPVSRQIAPSPTTNSGETAAPSSLSMLHADPGIRVVEGNPSSPQTNKTDKKKETHADFTRTARKHESTVQRFAQKMTMKYSVVQEYGREWMSYPDLRKLNDDYMRNHDPIAFMVGLSRAPSLGKMIKKYATRPEMREFVVEGIKSAPGDLTASAVEVLQNENVVKGLIANVTKGLGLPPSVTAMIGGAPPPDQTTLINDMVNSPAMKNAMTPQSR